MKIEGFLEKSMNGPVRISFGVEQIATATFLYQRNLL